MSAMCYACIWYSVKRVLSHYIPLCPSVYIGVKYVYKIADSWHQLADIWPTHYDDVVMGAIASLITSLTIVYSTVYSDADQRKHQSSPSLVFVWGIHRGLVNSPHKWPVTRKMFPFDDVIMSHMDGILILDHLLIFAVLSMHLIVYWKKFEIMFTTIICNGCKRKIWYDKVNCDLYTLCYLCQGR